MVRTRGPPRRPSQATPTGEEGREATSGFESLIDANPLSRGYVQRGTGQQSSNTPGPGTFHYPPPPSAHHNPRLAPLPSVVEQVPLPDDDDDDDDNDDGPEPEPHPSAPAGVGPPPPSSDSLIGDESAALAEYPYSIYNHGTWTADDDKTLIAARTRGQNWAELQRAHFPGKTANACRKRYERLVERRGIYDYGGRRLEHVASEYMGMRREIWSGLADRVGMKWEVVEALCMGVGLRTIQSNARSYNNRARRDNKIEQKARESRAEAVSITSTGLLPLVRLSPPPRGTAFVDRETATGGVSRHNAGLMPPPPFNPTTGPLAGGRLPPMALTPQEPFQVGGYQSSGSGAGPSQQSLPSRRPPDWGDGNTRGPV